MSPRVQAAVRSAKDRWYIGPCLSCRGNIPASRALSVRQLDGQNTVRYASVNYCAIICGMVFFENKNTTKLLMGTKRAVRMLWQFILSRMSFLLENAIKQIAGILSGFRAQNCLKVCVTTVSDSDQLNEMRQHDL